MRSYEILTKIHLIAYLCGYVVVIWCDKCKSIDDEVVDQTSKDL